MNYNKTEQIPKKVEATVRVCIASYNVLLSIIVRINKKKLCYELSFSIMKLLLQKQASHK